MRSSWLHPSFSRRLARPRDPTGGLRTKSSMLLAQTVESVAPHERRSAGRWRRRTGHRRPSPPGCGEIATFTNGEGVPAPPGHCAARRRWRDRDVPLVTEASCTARAGRRCHLAIRLRTRARAQRPNHGRGEPPRAAVPARFASGWRWTRAVALRPPNVASAISSAIPCRARGPPLHRTASRGPRCTRPDHSAMNPSSRPILPSRPHLVQDHVP